MISRTVYRNTRMGNKLPQAELVKEGDFMILSITLPGEWNFKAGQYIKLGIPGVVGAQLSSGTR